VPSGEGTVMTYDLDKVSSDVRSEELRRYRTVASVAEYLADIVTESSEDEFVVRAGASRPRGSLEGVIEFADLASIKDLREAE
jgi:hypothetical protein